jgi:hypothetical protein
MRYAIVLLALGALTSPQASAGELQSVYVAPGGIYIASGNVNVGTANGYPAYGVPDATYYEPRPAPPAYAPGYVAPGHVYRAPAYYEGYRSAYPSRPTYIDRSEYAYTYAEDLPPRPPASVPYNNGYRHCAFDPAYGRPAYCN